MKMILGIIMALYVICAAVIAHADLTVIGTATYLGSDYKLIWDDDNNGNSVIWLDYTNPISTWTIQKAWVAGLGSSLTYNYVGYTVIWDDEAWRLPSTVDGPFVVGYDGTTTGGYNITSSEMGHLYYEELGNLGYYDTSGIYVGDGNWGLLNTGDFDNLEPSYRWYWSGTGYTSMTNGAWHFYLETGNQATTNQNSSGYGLAIRSGQVSAAPEPVNIDIMPNKCPNMCRIRGGGFINVAILGAVDLDVNEIDIASVRLEGIAPFRSRIKDKSSPIFPPPTECECSKEGRDGFDDLCLKFKKRKIFKAVDGVNAGETYILTLTGALKDGTPIEGQDCIIILKKGKKD